MQTIRLLPNQLTQLQALSSSAAGSIALDAKGWTHEALDHLRGFLTQHGSVFAALSVGLARTEHPFHHNWTALDFAAACPHLQTLALISIDVNESVFHHPTLQTLKLERAVIDSGTTLEITGPLEDIRLEAVNWSRQMALVLKGTPHLRVFHYSLDEDDIESPPHTIRLEDCVALEDLYLNIHGSWDLALRGRFPRLNQFGAQSGRYGVHHIDLQGIHPSSASSVVMARDGHGSLNGHVFVFVGALNRLHRAKAEQAIRLMGGTVAEALSEAVTDIVVSDHDFATFDDEGFPNADILTELDFKDVIYNWY
jgi:hypothetical protein